MSSHSIPRTSPSVLPSAMRRGTGTRLLEAACTWATGRGYTSVTLTTYADIAWNAPFYAALERGENPDELGAEHEEHPVSETIEVPGGGHVDPSAG